MNRSARNNLMALVLLAATLPAFAATLLSNLTNTTNGDYGGMPDSAQSFVTGSVPMNVTSIIVLWQTPSDTPGVNQVGIYTDNGGVPSTTQVGGFFTNPNVTTTGQMTYTGTATLVANTTYWVVVDITDGSQVAYTFDLTYAADPSTGGASIAASSAYGDNLAGTWNNDNANLQIAITNGSAAATAVPSLGAWGVLILSGLLMLALLSPQASRAFGFNSRR